MLCILLDSCFFIFPPPPPPPPLFLVAAVRNILGLIDQEWG